MAKVKPVDAKSTLNTWDEADTELQELATLTAERNRIDSEKNLELQKVEQKYKPNLDKLNGDILGKEKNIELFVTEHKSEFDETRTKKMNYGEVGFRKGTGKLATLKGFTWEAVLKVIEKSSRFKKYLRYTVAINKEQILTDKLKEKDLASIGCHIKVDDTFFYDAYLKETKPVQ